MYTAEQGAQLTLWGCQADDLVCADYVNHRVAQDVFGWLVSLGWRVVVVHDGFLYQMNLLTKEEFERAAVTGAAFPVTAPYSADKDFATALFWLASQGAGGPG